MNAPSSLAANQVHRIQSLCGFLRNPAVVAAAQSSSPVSMPPTIGSMGFDVPLWVGLGVVGLWASLDAYLERTTNKQAKCAICSSRTCIFHRLHRHPNFSAMPSQAIAELEDLRHLFAHNFAGVADAAYMIRTRHVIRAPLPVTLSCGASVSGDALALPPSALQHYASRVSETLVLLQ
jgi:hypothetical protein